MFKLFWNNRNEQNKIQFNDTTRVYLCFSVKWKLSKRVDKKQKLTQNPPSPENIFVLNILNKYTRYIKYNDK